MNNYKAESIYTVTTWYDGAREGVADFQGKPHYYKCLQGYDDECKPTPYALIPIDNEIFQLELKNWNIWLRYQAAFKAGEATCKIHPALPEDQVRHDEIARILLEKAQVSSVTSIIATGEFVYGANAVVTWTVLPKESS
jgi:hypothetical protein